MKKIIAAILIIAALVMAFAACSTKEQGSDEFKLTEEMKAMLLEMGLAEEDFYSLPVQEQETLLLELGFDVSLGGGLNQGSEDKENNSNNNNNNKPPKTTLQDVENGGEWVVTVGDSLLWNYFELHYKDGKLWKIVCHFQKSSEEEPDIEVVEGEAAVAEFSYFFIDYTLPASQLVAEIQSKCGYTSVYIEAAK